VDIWTTPSLNRAFLGEHVPGVFVPYAGVTLSWTIRRNVAERFGRFNVR
jgi:hypothetical protein